MMRSLALGTHKNWRDTYVTLSEATLASHAHLPRWVGAGEGR